MTDGSAGYRAALEGSAIRERSERRFLRVSGRAPVRMLDGILTATLPGPETPVADEGHAGGGGMRAGRASYSTLLTPKGRMISDLRVLRTDAAPGLGDAAGAPPGGAGGAASGQGPAAPGMTRGPAVLPGGSGGGEELLLDVPEAGLAGMLEHFGRFIPPRFATVEDVTDSFRMITLAGPGAAGLLSLHALGLRVDEAELEGLSEGTFRSAEVGGSRLRVVRNADVAAPAFDLLGDPSTVETLARTLAGAGAVPLDDADWQTLRVEAGRPAFGVDMDDDTIPVEAGLGARAIDHGKGCYTGQEVIVRIRDRGHVNRSLRGLRLAGDDPAGPGTALYAPDVRGEREAGTLTTVVDSPRMGRVALGYVRREVPVGERVRTGSVEGPEAEVVDLDGGGWRP